MTTDTSPGPESPALFGKGMIIAIAVIVIALVAFLAAGLMQPGAATTGVGTAACGQETLAYINQNLVQEGTSAELVSAAENHGLYEMKVRYQSQESTLYTSKDCTLLFMSGMDMKAPAPTPAPTQAPVKSARPVADLYVMSFCPYGTQAEAVMKPVVDLLGKKADIRIRYITQVTGTTPSSVESLHGAPEAVEDLRQACVNKYYPDKFWPYLDAFNAACYPDWQNASALAACQKSVTASLGMDAATIDTCATGAEGIGLLKTDEAASNRDEAAASPTLVINGVTYAGSRTPEAYKQAICNSFDSAPAECSTVLASTSASAAGGCG